MAKYLLLENCMNHHLAALNNHVGKVQRIGIFCLDLPFLRFYAAGAHGRLGWCRPGSSCPERQDDEESSEKIGAEIECFDHSGAAMSVKTSNRLSLSGAHAA
jgi:hypothetical protein